MSSAKGGKKAWGKEESKTTPTPPSFLSASTGQSAGAANHPSANVAKSKKSTQGFALVKAVLSGDSVVLMGALPPGATQLPPERVIALSGIQAPRCARTKNQGNDEPYAYESREFLRKKVIGQTVQFDVAAVSEGGREYGKVLLNGDNLAHIVVRAGWATVKQPANQKEGAKIPPEREELLQLQEAAKAEGLGLHSRVSKPEDHIRKIDWNPDPRAFFNEHKNNRLPAIIDGVRDGSTIRAEIIGKGLTNTMITVLLAGAQSPRVPMPYSLMIQQYEKKRQEDPTYNGPRPLPEDAKPEPFGIDAQHFTESRLMHRDVHIILHGCDKFGNLFGTVDFPKGNITLKLLELGYSKLVAWSANLTPIAAQLKTAEESAKKNKLRIWTKYIEGQSSSPIADSDGNLLEESEPLPAEWQGKVVQIMQADTIIVEDAKGINRRVYLASIRCPKSGNPRTGQGEEAGAFEAREHVRNKLIGRKVKILSEYTRPAPPESMDQSIRQYVSILHNKLNISESLLLSGLATVMRHRIDESRSQFYDSYIAAEEKAIQSKVGIHVKGLLKPNRVIDLSERFVKKQTKKDDADEEDETEKKGKETASNKQKALSVKARQYLPLLQRDRSLNAVVEHVFSGTRVKLYLPSQHIAIAFVLAGIRGPVRKSDGSFDGYNDDAIAFAKSKLLQHDVRVEIDTMDKGDNFIGNLFIEHKNFATLLLSEGLATIYSYSADRSPYRNELIEAERLAREGKKGLWKDYVPPTPEELAKKAMEEKGDLSEDIAGQSRPIRITEIHDANNFFIQFADVNVVDTISSKLNELYADGADSEPFTPNPKGGQLCAGQWGEENEWYRVRVEGQAGDGEYRVVFIDYGNSDVIDQAHLRSLPDDVAKIPAQALHATLAGVAAPANADYFDDGVEAFGEMVWEIDLHARIEYIDRDRKYHVTLFDPTSAESEALTVNRALIRDGWARVAKRIDRRIQHLVDDLKTEEQEAIHNHAGIFEYGDVSDDEHEDDFLPRGKR